ncbi:MAG TPA: SufS family cysteine desulfurase [Patescibacteria group bacterium]|nr:SufS family cysteine desulfurase [Patescibacteria group bacterium]
MIDVKKIKKDFPIFEYHPDLVYLDSAATSLKPRIVIEKEIEYYHEYSVNIHRGIYSLAERATQEYENVRTMVSYFIGARDPSEIIFTRGATESINLIAYSLGRQIVSRGDEVVTTIMEHHSNFVPWQMLAFEAGADFKVIDIDENGELKIKSEKAKVSLEGIVTKKTKILAITYVSNVLSIINPVKEIVTEAKKINSHIIVIVDAAKAAPFIRINVSDLGADFVAFSAHKMLGPTGVGVLWGKKSLLTSMFPFNYGGGMIEEVTLTKTTFRDTPYKFEAGTPHISGVIAFGAALQYLKTIGLDEIKTHEEELAHYTLEELKEVFGSNISVYGKTVERTGMVSFNLKNIHAHDAAQMLDEFHIAVRAGHHCAMPLHKRLGIPASLRASFYIYNDEKDADALVQALKKVKERLQP